METAINESRGYPNNGKGNAVTLKLADNNIGAARGTDYFLMKEQLTKDEQDLLHSVRKFEVLPIVNSYWERGEF